MEVQNDWLEAGGAKITAAERPTHTVAIQSTILLKSIRLAWLTWASRPHLAYILSFSTLSHGSAAAVGSTFFSTTMFLVL